MKTKDVLASAGKKIFWLKNTIRSDRRIYIPLVAFFVALVATGSYLGYRTYVAKYAVPEVMGANFSLEYRKVPYDVASLDVTFSTDLDPASVIPASVSLSPYVEGKLSLKNGNVVSYALDKKLTIGEKYTLSIASSVRSKYGKNIANDFVVTFEAIAGAQATKILPSGKLQNLSQNIVVLFNIPVVPLQNLEKRDGLPCPLTVTPAIQGTCKWTAGNVLEFIPTQPLEMATRYHVSVANVPGLLYVIAGNLEADIDTPDLSVEIFTGGFLPSKGIPLVTNAPVDMGELTRSLDLSEGSIKLEEVVEASGTLSETQFFLKAKNHPYLYSTDYSLSVKKGLKPKYGNKPLKDDLVFTARSADFLSGVQVYRKIMSTTGAIIDTIEYGSDRPYIPSENVFFRAEFQEEIGLDTSLFALRSKTWEAVDFSLSYVNEPEYDEQGKQTGKTIVNKHRVDITPKASLSLGGTYSLSINKKANPSLAADIVKTYAVAPAFAVSDTHFLSNTETCIYVTNELRQNGPYADAYRSVKTAPASQVHDLLRDGMYDYQTGKETYRCPQVSGKAAYILGTRLAPFVDYAITFPKETEDVYGNRLGRDYTFHIKTQSITPKDQYLYSSLNKDVQVIPSNLPITLNLQSINLDRANLEICEMNDEGYRHFLSNRYNPRFAPICVSDTLTGVTLKNHYWTLTPNRFDLEKDILWRAFSSSYVFVRGSTAGFGQAENGYMDAQKEFMHLFIRSNLSLTLEDAQNKKLLFASSYDGKMQPGDLTFETYSRSEWGTYQPLHLNILFNRSTNVYEVQDPNNKLSLVIAKNGQYFWVLNKNEDQVSNYDFKYIAGQDSATKDYLYVYADRPLYKAGDEVYFKGLLRTFRFDGYHQSSVKNGKLRIVGEATGYGEEGALLKEMDVTLDKNANFNGKFTLPKEMPFGRYHFEFYAGADKIFIYNNGEFYVEAYKKPVFRVEANLSKSDALLGESADLSARAEYYFGGRLASTNYTYSILSQDYYFDAKDFADYQFGEGSAYMDCLYWGSCEYGDHLVTVGSGRLDGQGQTTVHYDYPKTETPERDQGEKIYTYTVEVTDPDTGKTVSAQTSQILHTTDGYVGIRVPYWNEKKKGIRVDGTLLDIGAKPKSGWRSTIEVIKREWKDIKKQGVDGTFYHESSVEEKLESTRTVVSDRNGEFRENFVTQWDGEYKIRAIYTGANGQSFVSSSIVYVSGENMTYWNDGNNSVTDLVADKSILNVGDTAGFTLRSPIASGKMLITVEKDDGILDYRLQDIASTAPRIEFPIKESYLPNVYVKVFLIGQDTNSKLPVYKRALSIVKVLTDPKKLSISLQTDKARYLPGDPVKVTVSVKDASGRPISGANGSLSIVDESLLALAGNPKKNPFAFFYDMKRYLGIETYVSLLNLIERLEVKDTSTGEKGGAWEGQKGGQSRKKRGVFKDTAFWMSDFTTDQNGNYIVTTDKLPDNLTTWNIEALLNTSDNRVGVANTSVQTTKSVIVNDNLPRFLGASDSVEIAPVVFNKTGKDATFDVSIASTNANIENPKKSVFIKTWDQASVGFMLRVVDSETLHALPETSARIALKAVSRETGDLDEVENILPIVDTAMRETVATVGKTDTSADEKVAIPEALRAGGGSLTVTYAATLLPNLLSGIGYLEHFPYWCIEQRLAAVMPTVYLKELYESAKLPYDLKTKTVKEYRDKEEGYREKSVDDLIRETLLSIKNFQKPDGGFAYWTDSPRSDFSLTVTTLSRLSEIRSIGYAVNSEVLNRAVAYIKKQFYANKRDYCRIDDPKGETCKYSLAERLGAIESVLDATSQDYEAYKMYRLLTFDENGVGAKITRVRVLAKLLRINEISKSDKDALRKDANGLMQSIVNEWLVYNPRGAFLRNDGVFSRLDNTSRFIEAVAFFGRDSMKGYEQVLDQMERWTISEKKPDGSFWSTYETVGAIAAIAHAMRASGELADINLRVAFSLDMRNIEERSIDANSKLSVFSKTIPLSDLRDNSTLHVEKSGQGNLYYDLALSYSVPSKSIASRDEWFYLEQSWYDYDAYREIEKLKKEEWSAYFSGSIAYKDIKYPKEVVQYLSPITTPSVGKLVYVHNRAIFGEPRDQVSFEGLIPAGAELVNPGLKTENQSTKFNTLFDHEEFRDDRYFGTVSSLPAGVYSFGYVMRPTHAGVYQMLPSRIFEFYHPEVFGRTAGKSIKIAD